MIYQGSNRYPVTEAVLHCAAINTGQFDGYTPQAILNAVKRWHLQRNFKREGYHVLCIPDGGLYMWRPFDMQGAHVIEANRGTLGILMIESRKITKVGEFSDWFTDAQRDSVRALLRNLPCITKVSGHNDYAAKLCPGFKVKTSYWLA